MMLIWLWVAVLVIGLDQYTKYLAETNLQEHMPVAVLPVFNWFLTYNPGAAWSLLRDAGPWKHWFFLGSTAIVVVILSVWMYSLKRDEKIEAISFSLILGGAVGNVIDRLRIEKVVDFIQLHYNDWYFPAFNIADSAITLGVAILIFRLAVQIKHDWKQRQKVKQQSEAG